MKLKSKLVKDEVLMRLDNDKIDNDRQKFARVLQGKKYFSQAGQDLFVLEMLKSKSDGFYIEIGGADPFDSNNTCLLEFDFRWKGFAIELNALLAETYRSNRRNNCFLADAVTFDYKDCLKKLRAPNQIDYLSVDIDPAENSYNALIKCPFDSYRFSVITFEHDAYASGTEYMTLSRNFLTNHGYQLVVSNVKCFGRDFEDWWVDPSVVSESIWRRYLNSNIEFSDVFA